MFGLLNAISIFFWQFFHFFLEGAVGNCLCVANKLITSWSEILRDMTALCEHFCWRNEVKTPIFLTLRFAQDAQDRLSGPLKLKTHKYVSRKVYQQFQVDPRITWTSDYSPTYLYMILHYIFGALLWHISSPWNRFTRRKSPNPH